jgi:hypothetical protein
MATPTPIAKVSTGKSGYSAAHASYITRMSALDPDGRERQRSGEENRDEQLSLLTHDERTQWEPNATETLDENLMTSHWTKRRSKGKQTIPMLIPSGLGMHPSSSLTTAMEPGRN